MTPIICCSLDRRTLQAIEDDAARQDNQQHQESPQRIERRPVPKDSRPAYTGIKESE